MEPDFWLQRWQLGQTGWHQDEPHWALVRHWSALALGSTARVFVPLAGRSLDLLWLAQRGHAVVGCELSPLAVRKFYAEQARVPEVLARGAFELFRAGPIEMLCGDLFELESPLLGRIDAVYDRAALVALPPGQRGRYARKLAQLSGAHAPTLLVTTEYDGVPSTGPPFAVSEAEVRTLYGGESDIELLERRADIADAERFRARGVTGFTEAAYRITPRARAAAES